MILYCILNVCVEFACWSCQIVIRIIHQNIKCEVHKPHIVNNHHVFRSQRCSLVLTTQQMFFPPLSPSHPYPVPLSPSHPHPVPLSPLTLSPSHPVPLSPPSHPHPVPLSPLTLPPSHPVPLSPPSHPHPVPLSPDVQESSRRWKFLCQVG